MSNTPEVGTGNNYSARYPQLGVEEDQALLQAPIQTKSAKLITFLETLNAKVKGLAATYIGLAFKDFGRNETEIKTLEQFKTLNRDLDHCVARLNASREIIRQGSPLTPHEVSTKEEIVVKLEAEIKAKEASLREQGFNEDAIPLDRDLQDLRQQLNLHKQTLENFYAREAELATFPQIREIWEELNANLTQFVRKFKGVHLESSHTINVGDSIELKKLKATQKKVQASFKEFAKEKTSIEYDALGKKELLNDFLENKALLSGAEEGKHKASESSQTRSIKEFTKLNLEKKQELILRLTRAAARDEHREIFEDEILRDEDKFKAKLEQMKSTIRKDLELLPLLKENWDLLSPKDEKEFQNNIDQIRNYLEIKLSELDAIQVNPEYQDLTWSNYQANKLPEKMAGVFANLENSSAIIRGLGLELRAHLPEMKKDRKEKIDKATAELSQITSVDKTKQALFEIQVVLLDANLSNGKVVLVTDKKSNSFVKFAERETGIQDSQIGTSQESTAAITFILNTLLTGASHSDSLEITQKGLDALESSEWFKSALKNNAQREEFQSQLSKIKDRIHKKSMGSSNKFEPLASYFSKLADRNQETLRQHFLFGYRGVLKSSENAFGQMAEYFKTYSDEEKLGLYSLCSQWVNSTGLHGNDLPKAQAAILEMVKNGKDSQSKDVQDAATKLEGLLKARLKLTVRNSPPLTPGSLKFEEGMKLEGQNRVEFIKKCAQDLDQIFAFQLGQIPAWEFLDNSDRMKEYTDMLNQFTDWVQSEILKPKDNQTEIWSQKGTHIAAKRIEFFIDLAQEMKQNHNFEGMYMIIVILNSTQLSRLEKTWENVSKKHKKMKEEMNKIENNNFSDYRAQVKGLGTTSYIPIMGQMSKDIIFAGDSDNSSKDPALGPNLNISKLEMLGGFVSQVHQAQINLPNRGNLETNLPTLISGATLSVNEKFEYSYLLEPRKTKKIPEGK